MSKISPQYPYIVHYLRREPFLVVSTTMVDIIECIPSTPWCIAIMSVQPVYTQWLKNLCNALWGLHWINSRVSPEDGIHRAIIQVYSKFLCHFILKLNCLIMVYTSMIQMHIVSFFFFLFFFLSLFKFIHLFQLGLSILDFYWHKSLSIFCQYLNSIFWSRYT